MYHLQNTLNEYSSYFKDTSILGTFIDNHDQQRFLDLQRDYELYKSAITFVLLTQGIPTIYYGTEQGYHGGDDPYNRETLWPNYNTKSELYQFISKVVMFRKKMNVQNEKQIQRYCDDNFYSFTRGQILVALTNGGSGQASIMRSISYHPYKDGTKLCNLFYEQDCISVKNGVLNVVLLHGESKIFYPV